MCLDVLVKDQAAIQLYHQQKPIIYQSALGPCELIPISQIVAYVEAKSLEEMEESVRGRGWGGEVLEKTRLNDGPSHSDIGWSLCL